MLFRKVTRRMQKVVTDLAVRGTTRQWLAKVKAAAETTKAEAESAVMVSAKV